MGRALAGAEEVGRKDRRGSMNKGSTGQLPVEHGPQPDKQDWPDEVSRLPAVCRDVIAGGCSKILPVLCLPSTTGQVCKTMLGQWIDFLANETAGGASASK